MKPLLVVCCESARKSTAYAEALVHLGAPAESVHVVLPEAAPADAEGLAAGAAGLMLCGGPDLDPWRYGEEPRADASLSLRPELDALEWRMLQGARRGRTPVWAICRGLQTVNVFLGGTLWQDLPTQRPGAVHHQVAEPPDAPAHTVEVLPGADRFGPLSEGETLVVNSRHHQAVRRLASDLAEVARAPDGVVEIIAGTTPGWWIRGVQWHPEDLLDRPEQRRLWLDFLRVAGASEDGTTEQRAGAR